MGWVINVTPRPLYARERPGTPCTGRWVGPKAGLDGCGKSRPPPVFDPRTFQPVVSCTDWANPAPIRATNWNKIKLCFDRLNTCGLFRNKHNGIVAIKTVLNKNLTTIFSHPQAVVREPRPNRSAQTVCHKHHEHDSVIQNPHDSETFSFCIKFCSDNELNKEKRRHGPCVNPWLLLLHMQTVHMSCLLTTNTDPR